MFFSLQISVLFWVFLFTLFSSFLFSFFCPCVCWFFVHFTIIYVCYPLPWTLRIQLQKDSHEFLLLIDLKRDWYNLFPIFNYVFVVYPALLAPFTHSAVEKSLFRTENFPLLSWYTCTYLPIFTSESCLPLCM